MNRIVYYVIGATSEENQNGTFHYSQPYAHESSARKFAQMRRKKLGNDGHVAIEKHHEILRSGSWEVDHDNGGTEMVDYI